MITQFRLAALGLALAASPLAAQAPQVITGAGATFPAPVYLRWGEQFRAQSGVGLNYQAVGSGAGQTQITNRTVDFGASDAPMDPTKLQQANLLQFPAIIGAVVVIANIDGVDEKAMRLTGPVLAAIYQGQIRSWGDPRIRALNPALKLPNAPIVPVRRADGSGTTYVFTSYLSAVSQDWRANVGAATSVEWRTGVGARGNDGVAAAVRQTRGAIGYVEYVFAAANNLGYTQLQSRDGPFVRASAQSFAAAAARADFARAANMAPSMVNMPGPGAWPIVSASYVLVPRNPSNPARAANVLRFFDWAFTSGGPAAAQLHYITLPPAVQAMVRASWANVRVNNRPVFAPVRAPQRRAA